ncbi:MAG: prepilin peptidase [Candidatus Andersenbacteria bacterium]
MEFDWLLLGAGLVLGATIGSFLNVVILRFSSGQPIGLSRSACPHCHHTLAWYDLLPVLSFVLLGGKCRYCHKSISIQYPLVEAVNALAVVYFILFLSHWLVLGALLYVIFALLLVLFVIDLQTFLLPDFYIVLLSVAVVLYHALAQTLLPTEQFWGLVIGSGALLLLWAITKGKGIGFGDVKLLIPLGIFFGPSGAISLLFLAFVVGGAVGGALLILGKATPKTAIPFGPFLAGAAMLLMLYPPIVSLFEDVFLGPYNAVLYQR